MAIVRLQHIGIAIRDPQAACDSFEKLSRVKACDFRDDQGGGMRYNAHILLGNEYWPHLVQNWNPESRVYKFLEKYGEGLEYIALETDSTEADVQHLHDIGVPIYQDKIFDAQDGFEAFAYPDQPPGLTVELTQLHPTI